MAPKKKAARSRSASFLRRWIFHPLTIFVCAGVATLSGLGAVIPSMITDLRAQAEYHFALDQLRVNPANDWVPTNLVEQVLAESHQPASVSLLDPNLAQELASAFARHPWVAHVDRVQITGHRNIVVQLQYRYPVAFIRQGGKLIAVDQSGVVLPPDDFSVADHNRLPHIHNIASLPAGSPGTAWGDPLVLESLKIAGALTPRHNIDANWSRLKLAAIVAPETTYAEDMLPHRLTFELETQGGSRIVWGHPPGGDDLEPTVVQKLGRLDQYLKQFGSFEQPRGPYRIDIRHFEAISLQPLDTRVHR